MRAPEKKSFWALIVTQFFGAFNDNVLKVLVQLLVVEWVSSLTSRSQLVDLATAIFDAPFLIFSMMAGRVSDRLGKPKVIKGVQVWQLLVVAAAVVSLFTKSIAAMMGSIFLLSMQAAFFSPAKYGILPELMDESELSDGNGILNTATFIAILVGTLIGSFLVDRVIVACAALVVAAVGGLVGSFFIESLPAAKPGEPIPWSPLRWLGIFACLFLFAWLYTFAHLPHRMRFWSTVIVGIILIVLAGWENAPDLVENWKIIQQDRSLTRGIIAVNYFWFVGAVLITNIFLYANEMLHATSKQAGILLIVVTVGIALGSFLAGKLSEGRVELGLVPLGAFGMSLFAIDTIWAWHSIWHSMSDFFFLGMCGGLYEVPLNSLIQWRSPAAERGRVLATQNFLSFVAILIATGVLWILNTPLHLNPAQVFFVLGLASFIGTVVIYTVLPAPVWRLALYAVTNLFYRLTIEGSENIPMKGPALLVCNHLSLADGLLVSGAMPRLVRFLVWRPYYEARWLHWLAKTMKAIPISDTDPPRQIMSSLLEARKALEEGDLVCIFAEGEISRTGNLLEFKRGMEVIAKGLDVPVIPVHLDRVWGSIFSFEHGNVIFKKPRRIPYPVTVTFGKPVATPIQPSTVRQVVLDLGADAFKKRLEEWKPLPLEFLRQAKRHPRRLAVADSSGLEFSYGRLAAVSGVLAHRLGRLLSPGECVGILLPSSVPAVLANLAVSLSGWVPVNLNYTAGVGALEAAVQKAKIQHILTSRKLLEKTGLPTLPSMLFVEDLLALLPRSHVLLERILFALQPTRVLLRQWGATASHSLESTATVMFSSGSTGIPKGVVLTHANILSNILSLSQVFDVGAKDRMIGVLPFFHSFGFTGTLWFPLINGFGAVYHGNPLDAKSVGELSEKYSATMLLATPTFLAAYIRKCTREQFRSLRFVIVGAERLRESIAQAFLDRFGRTPLEGYGCTELSPVAAVNVPDVSMGEITQIGHKPGKVGQPIPGVSVRIVDPETFAPRPQGEDGLMVVKGPNVMKGYLDDPEKTFEVLRDGWYVTGDVARVDPDGFIQIVDRLTRISKIGGEMVPHVLVEEKLHQLAERTDPTFVVASAPEASKGEQLVVLYSGYEGSIDALWKKLQESDLPKLWIPAKDRFYAIPQIPYLGTGKLDLAQVRQIVREKTAGS